MNRTRMTIAVLAAIVMMSLLAEQAGACCHKVRLHRGLGCHHKRCCAPVATGGTFYSYERVTYSYGPVCGPVCAAPQPPVSIPVPPPQSPTVPSVQSPPPAPHK